MSSSRDSHAVGLERGREDGLAGRPEQHPRREFRAGDDGYREFWGAYEQGYAAGQEERLEREAMGAAG